MKKKEKQLPTKSKASKASKASKTSSKRNNTKATPRAVPAVRGTKGSTVYASSTTKPQEASAHPSLSKHLKTTTSTAPAPAPAPAPEPQYRSPAEAARARKAKALLAEKSTLDAHTYDKGYKKWEKFDVDAELARVDQADKNGKTVPTTTPSSTTATKASTRVVNTRKNAAPTVSREELYKQDGNKHYKRGEFQQAIKCYTRCIASNPRNAVVSPILTPKFCSTDTCNTHWLLCCCVFFPYFCIVCIVCVFCIFCIF